MNLEKLGKGVQIAEAERDKTPHTGFVAELFRGHADFSMFNVFNNAEEPDRKVADELVQKLKDYFLCNLNPEEVDRTDEVPEHVLEWLCREGYFGLKIPKEYGGYDLCQTSYMRVMAAISSYCSGAITAVSASNTIGAGFPIKAYGTEEQKKRFLPILAKSPSGFAFTEKEAGSDPARMRMTAVRIYDDAMFMHVQRGMLERGLIKAEMFLALRETHTIGYKLTGTKWWTTCGPRSADKFLSQYLCVVAKIVDQPEEIDDKNYKPCFGAFIVDTSWQGIEIVQRCQFEGLRGIYNGITSYDNVRVPKDHLVGEKEGTGFKIAIEALNTGRITVAGSCSAIARQVTLIEAWWGKTRKQWGQEIGKHEAIGTGKLVKNLSDTLAMEAMAKFAGYRANDHLDTRLEAATAKVFASERGWQVVDDALQVFGGRGYETAQSLAKRGEPKIPIERIHRAFRPNRIFEGSSELLSMWVIREGIDGYKKRGEVMLEKGHFWEKAKTATGFARDVIKLSMPGGNGALKNIFVYDELKPHLNFVAKTAKQLARSVILAAGKYQGKLPFKQMLFQRFFWIAAELYAISATCFYAAKLSFKYEIDGGHVGSATADQFIRLADYYCREARRRVSGANSHFDALTENDDELARKISKDLAEGWFDGWLKEDILPLTETLKLS